MDWIIIIFVFAIGFFFGFIWRGKKHHERHEKYYKQYGQYPYQYVKPRTQSSAEILIKLFIVILIVLGIIYSSGVFK